MELIFFCILQPMLKPWRFTRSMCSLPLSDDSCSYSFGNDEHVFVESRLTSYYLARPRPEWKIILYRQQERKLICNYEYMPNCLQCGVEIYRRHLEMKAKSEQ